MGCETIKMRRDESDHLCQSENERYTEVFYAYILTRVKHGYKSNSNSSNRN